MTAFEADALVMVSTGVLLYLAVRAVRVAWTLLTWPIED